MRFSAYLGVQKRTSWRAPWRTSPFLTPVRCTSQAIPLGAAMSQIAMYMLMDRGDCDLRDWLGAPVQHIARATAHRTSNTPPPGSVRATITCAIPRPVLGHPPKNSPVLRCDVDTRVASPRWPSLVEARPFCPFPGPWEGIPNGSLPLFDILTCMSSCDGVAETSFKHPCNPV